LSADVGLSETKRRLLESMLRGEGVAPPGRRPERVTPRPPAARVPISPEQRHVWLHAGMAHPLPLYNEPVTFHRKGPFDLAVLEASLNEILRRHEIWRTSFGLVDGEVVQTVHPELRVRLPLHDLSRLSEAEREAAALRIATEQARQPFDLAAAPLFRADVVRMAPDYHRLYLALHHIIFDGVSIYHVVMPELTALYEAFARGERPALARPALQYGEWLIPPAPVGL
jgi:condensation domain-containing protein